MPNPSLLNLLTGDLPQLAATVQHQRLNWRVAEDAGVVVYLRRDDAIHAKLSGNKLYKLHGHLQAYFESAHSKQPIASFGGAYSNHLYALAAAGQILGVPTIAVIRGERPKGAAPTLDDLEAMGMRLHFISRERYKLRNDQALLMALNHELGEPCFWVPEGGAGLLGNAGCQVLGASCSEFLQRVTPSESDVYVVMACGTGTTFSGVVNGVGPSVQVLGVPVLKVGGEYKAEIAAAIGSNNRWELLEGGHCGGYAKFPEYLLKFMVETELEVGVQLDPVYTAKMLYSLATAIKQGKFARGSHIVAIHSGGLQGRRSVEKQLMELYV